MHWQVCQLVPVLVQDLFLEKHGVKLGFMSAFVKAAADALQAVPAVNGVIDGTDIIYRDYYDISIAVATPKGLVVPVLRNANQLDFAGVERVNHCCSPDSAQACSVVAHAQHASAGLSAVKRRERRTVTLLQSALQETAREW